MGESAEERIRKNLLHVENCNFCQKVNHFDKMCRKNNTPGKVDEVEAETELFRNIGALR